MSAAARSGEQPVRSPDRHVDRGSRLLHDFEVGGKVARLERHGERPLGKIFSSGMSASQRMKARTRASELERPVAT